MRCAAATAVISGRLFCDKCNSGIQVPITRSEVVLNCTTYVLPFNGDEDYYGVHPVLCTPASRPLQVQMAHSASPMSI
eukprot:jgi/Chlat1/6755/Chrsp50S06447